MSRVEKKEGRNGSGQGKEANHEQAMGKRKAFI